MENDIEQMTDDMADVATTMRIPARTYAGIRQAAAMQRTTAIELIRAAVMPYAHMADTTRADGFKTLAKAIAQSCDKAAEESKMMQNDHVSIPWDVPTVFQDTNLRDYHGIRVYADPTTGAIVHRILMYEGQARWQVIMDYARSLWDVLNNVHRDDSTAWQTACDDLCDPERNRYIIGRVGFENWRSFESEAELTQWRIAYDPVLTLAVNSPREAKPETPEDWAVWGWCTQNIEKIYNERNEPTDPARDVSGQIWLFDYPDFALSNQVARWSSIVMQTCRDSGQTVDDLARWDWQFQTMTIAAHKPRKGHRKQV